MTSDTNSDTASIPHGPTNRSKPDPDDAGRQSGDLSTTIVMEVADALDTDPIDLSPSLHELFDPDALNALFESADDGSETYFTISEWGCTVSVLADGRVLVDVDTR